MKKGMSAIMFDNASAEEAIRAASKIGYDGIELRTKPGHLEPDTKPERLRELGRLIADGGLEVPCIACFTGNYVSRSDTECEQQIEELKRYVEYAIELGSPALRHWAAAKPSSDATADDWKRAAEWVGRAAEITSRSNLILALELHHGTVIDSVESAMDFIDMVGSGSLRVLHDAANLYQQGVDYGRESIKALGDRLLEVHMKDIVEVLDDSSPYAGQPYMGRRFANRLIGQGGVDQYSILRGLKDARFDGYLVVESGWLSWLEPFEVAEYSLKAINDLLREMDMN